MEEKKGEEVIKVTPELSSPDEIKKPGSLKEGGSGTEPSSENEGPNVETRPANGPVILNPLEDFSSQTGANF